MLSKKRVVRKTGCRRECGDNVGKVLKRLSC
jgi:hypothetical protein